MGGLLKIKNAQKSRKLSVVVKFSSFLVLILKSLRSEGYIRGFVINFKEINVFLKYINGKPAFSKITLVSKPGRRLFLKKKSLTTLGNKDATGSLLLTTSQGVLTKKEVLTKDLGGEGLFFII